ncbi:glycosyltransferase family 4 protein [Methylobacterium gnaphalii]|uniref:Glycosyl transferase n=1 Tax=Methylobacterium gnaphalii TaxID=1010610 RepID=A0A512JKN8_9HYPH|nr:glycosyltransferase family 4 protein [Methylobacterium gnaphalii]GEP10510.1 glycosyl transferase [Methylobacterium gnaphalii]GJD69263.1 GDP-mannose:cellobiosyl-diphosphopolyprenol alpha-mannosyltransferase [Methylobacterium gnaphalii]GLS47926.1 glycosyl transferase [Methylobacterium gnaphalii]
MKPPIKPRRRAPGRPLKVMMLGLRGLPRLQGGVERHVEELASRLARAGCSVEILARQPYVERKGPHRWSGLLVMPLPAPRVRSLEAVVHTFVGVIHAARRGPDILHIHAVGPSLLVPVARALGLRVVVTHHGFDYDRAKWGRVAKTALRLGEWAGMRFADRRIAVSHAIAGTMTERYGVPVATVPNGVTPQARPTSTGALERFGLTPGRYVVIVSRLVPEKRHFDLIEAFAQGAPEGWQLAIVGAADHEDTYSRLVLSAAEATPGVVATGFQSGLALRELRAHAGLFVLPSSHEGLPIALLEALADGLPVIASDIPANREVGLPEECYVPVGDIPALAAAIARSCARPLTEAERDAARARVSHAYDWDTIAGEIRRIYESLHQNEDREPDTDGLIPIPRPSP